MPGSIEKRGKNSWRLVISAGLGAEGRQIKKTRSITVSIDCPQKSCKGCAKIARCRARKEAEQALAEFVLEIEKGTFVAPSKLTFKEFAEKWLRDYGETNLAPKTLFRYRQMLESRVYQAMGHLKMEQIKPPHLLEFYRNLAEEGIREDGREGKLSNSTIHHHHRMLSALFNDAVEWGIIAFNPASRVKPPKVQKKQALCYDEEQLAALFKALEAENLKHKTLVLLALFTGMRRGEIMALEWGDINFEERTIAIRRAAQYLPGLGAFTKDPKTETSSRIISVPPVIISLLKDYRKQWLENRLKVGDLWQGSERLFVTWDGRPGHPEWPSQWFSKFIKKHKLPALNFHGLRHTAATMMINTGVPAKVVSGHFGHANIKTTYDIYGHYLRSADKEAADRLEQYYQKLKENAK